MKYTLDKTSNPKYPILTLCGYINTDEISTFIQELWEDETYITAAQLIWDFSQSESDFYFEDVFSLSEFVKQKRPSNVLKRLAIVAPGDYEFGMSRIYASLSENEEPAVRVYRDINAARLWLEDEN